jgi:hypothetical protein
VRLKNFAVNIFAKIAEQRIKEAIVRGDFDDLEGKGRPLKLEDETWVPEDLRPAYRVLKNAGCVPPELDLKKEIVSLKSIIDALDDDKERLKKIRELNFKLLKFNKLRKGPFDIEDFPEYQERIYKKFIPE